jgi:hypothetical protein
MSGVGQPPIPVAAQFADAQIVSPLGDVYDCQRQRYILDDQIQLIGQQWDFDPRGVWEVNSPALDEPRRYNVLASRYTSAYQEYWDIGKMHRFSRLKQDSLTDTDEFYKWIAHLAFAIGRCVAIAGVFLSLRTNEAFQSLSAYLPDRMIRLQDIWATLSSVVGPELFKQEAIRANRVITGTRFPVLHYRAMVSDNLDMYGPLTDFATYAVHASAPSANQLESFLTAATIDHMLDEIQSVAQALAGTMSSDIDADRRNDWLSINEIFRRISQVKDDGTDLGQLIKAGLPDLFTAAQPVVDDSVISEWYARLFTIEDTVGISTDNMVAFPVVNNAQLTNRIPIKGWGDPNDIHNFTLLGSVKCAASIDDTAGNIFADQSSPARLLGMYTPVMNSGSLAQNRHGLYTREDGWFECQYDNTDFGDGAAIAAYINSGTPLRKHIYADIAFAKQLDTDLELHFMDRVPTDYEFWLEPDHLGERTDMVVARMLGIPYKG